MKIIIILMITALNFGALAQEGHSVDDHPVDMTLLGKGSEKPITIEDKKIPKKTLPNKKQHIKNNEDDKKSDQ